MRTKAALLGVALTTGVLAAAATPASAGSLTPWARICASRGGVATGATCELDDLSLLPGLAVAIATGESTRESHLFDVACRVAGFSAVDSLQVSGTSFVIACG